MLDEAEVAVVPGEAFGTPGYFRLSAALADADLEEGLTRMANLLGLGQLAGWPDGSTCYPRRTCICTSPARCGARTLIELAATHGIRLPEAFGADWPPLLRGTDERGWFRFQRLYDSARAVLRTEADVRRLITELALDEKAEGSGWLEFQVDPSGYAARFGGLTAFTELVLDATATAASAAGIGMSVIIAANRTRHPLDARTAARLAAGYAGRGVTGFGLSNDERRGRTLDFAPAFRIASKAGLIAVPHGGELEGPAERPRLPRSSCTPTGSGMG